MADAADAPDALSYPADRDIDIDIDINHLLQVFSHEDDLLDLSADIWIPDAPPPPPTTATTEEEQHDSPEGESGGSPNPVSPYVSDIEKFLMEEEGEGEGVNDVAAKEGFDADDFFACLFSEGSRDAGSEVATPDSESAVESKTKEKDEEETPVAADGEDDNPVSKKLRRQMRNRDSAMKSRERKKMYVKELEMKSKYLEAECRRLDYALRCCAAENMALHQRLQKERLFGAAEAKQESAVLFVESLLLGSLSWLISIICLLPVLPNLILKDINPLGRGFGHEVVVAERVTNKRLETNLSFTTLRRNSVRAKDSIQALEAELEPRCRRPIFKIPLKGSLIERVESLELLVLKLTTELEERERMQSFRLMSSANDKFPTKQKEVNNELGMIEVSCRSLQEIII